MARARVRNWQDVNTVNFLFDDAAAYYYEIGTQEMNSAGTTTGTHRLRVFIEFHLNSSTLDYVVYGNPGQPAAPCNGDYLETDGGVLDFVITTNGGGSWTGYVDCHDGAWLRNVHTISAYATVRHLSRRVGATIDIRDHQHVPVHAAISRSQQPERGLVQLEPRFVLGQYIARIQVQPISEFVVNHRRIGMLRHHPVLCVCVIAGFTALSACGSALDSSSPVAGSPVQTIDLKPAETATSVASSANVTSVGTDADVSDLFHSPTGPLSGPSTLTGTVDDATKRLGRAVPSLALFGSVAAVAFDDSSVKLLYQGALGTVMTVQSATPVFHSADDMSKLAAQYADAPTTQHPTRVTVVTLATSGLTAIALDPVFDAGPTPNRVRSATFDIGDIEFTIYLSKARDEKTLLGITDDLAVEALVAFPPS